MYGCAVEIMIFSVGVNIYFLGFQLSVYYQTITQHADDWLTNRTLLIFGNAHKIGAGKVVKSICPSVKFRCFSGHGRRDFLIINVGGKLLRMG